MCATSLVAKKNNWIMKKFLMFLLVSAVAFLAADECNAQFSKLSLGDYGIKSISPESFRSVSGAVWLEVTNPAEGFTVSDISGVVYKNNTPFVKGTASSFRVYPGTGKVVVSGHASLCDGVSLWTVLSLLSFNPEEYSVDIIMKVTMDSGESRMITKFKVPVSVLLKLK